MMSEVNTALVAYWKLGRNLWHTAKYKRVCLERLNSIVKVFSNLDDSIIFWHTALPGEIMHFSSVFYWASFSFTESGRLEGTTGDYLVQPPLSFVWQYNFKRNTLYPPLILRTLILFAALGSQYKEECGPEEDHKHDQREAHLLWRQAERVEVV